VRQLVIKGVRHYLMHGVTMKFNEYGVLFCLKYVNVLG